MLKIKFKVLIISVLVFLLSPIVLLACLWDYDTLKMERSRFPTTLELITGKFLRHTPEFYQWRIKDRLKKLEKDPNNVLLLDDLAVAYDKTKQDDKAIETAEKIEKIKPGRYETMANLGTFYFHSGRLEEGLPYIDKALKINPDAHFGREYYQKLLVEYLLQQRKTDSQKLPLANIKQNEKDDRIIVSKTFASFLDVKLHPELAENPNIEYPDDSGIYFSNVESEKALKGILGMMRFGSHDSPILLEALGTILSPNNSMRSDAKLLACRAYLKASYEAPNISAREEYRTMAKHVLHLQANVKKIEDVEEYFAKELSEGKNWYEELKKNELQWIQEGKNPEIEFDKLYDDTPELSGGYNFFDKVQIAYTDFDLNRTSDQIIFIIAITFLAIIFIIIKNRIQKKKLKIKTK